MKTGALGGEGANIAKQLLRKGINVLLEQPVHYKELGECYKIAQNQKVYFGVGNLYLNLPAVQNFIRNVHIVSKTEKIAYINVDLATQVSYPVISILGEVLQTLRPWENVGSICGHVPFQTETVKIGDIPISFRAHNEIEKENIDGFLHMLFRISVGFAGGQLTLFDPDGPVIWNPRIHFPDENIIPGRLEFHSPLNMDEQNSFILYSSEKKQKMIFKDEWPCAIAKDIEKTVVEPTEPTLQYIQRILNNSHAWQLLMKGLGYPEIVSGSFYSYYPSEKLLRESTSLFEKSSALLGGMAVFNNMCLKTMYYYLQQNIKEVNKGYTSDELIERMLYYSKIQKFGMVSLTGLICGILMLLTGMGYWSIITGFVFGVLADLILKSGDYKSAKKGIISHGVFSMWIIGNYIPIVVTRDSYYQDLITGYSQEYADAIMGYISAYTLPLLLIAGFVCGVIGGIIGQKIFKKHFKRAGIA